MFSVSSNWKAGWEICSVLDTFAKLRKATISLVMSVGPLSALNYSATTGRIFIKEGI